METLGEVTRSCVPTEKHLGVACSHGGHTQVSKRYVVSNAADRAGVDPHQVRLRRHHNEGFNIVDVHDERCVGAHVHS